MVYCGKPSKSCEACRKTKTKCDQGRPACGQCIRTRRVCPGYRDLGALVFRNETSRVVQKARQIYSETTEDTQPGLERQIEPYMSSIPGSILTSRKDQAIGVFFDQYATDVEGCYDYVRSVCSQPVCRGLLILYDTIELIGLAYIYGTRYGRPCRSAMELDVYRKHSAVLHAVNDALGIGSIATRDEIIVSVLLLGLFEAVTCMAPKSFYSWRDHIQGATALVKARGLKQFETSTGRRIFAHFLDYVMLSALQRSVPVPKEIVDIASLPCTAVEPIEKTRQALFKISADLANVRSMNNTEAISAETLLSLTKGVDISFANWAASVPDEYKFTTETASLDQNTLNGVFHRYPGFGIARIWNIYRMNRLLNAECTARLAATTETPTSLADLESALDRQLELCVELCNSLPAYIMDPKAKAVIGITVVWPLYTVATIDSVTAGMRLWSLEQMRAISKRTGAMQGVQFADVLANQWDLTIWKREDVIMDASCDVW